MGSAIKAILGNVAATSSEQANREFGVFALIIYIDN
jgi:hypothetical protein